MREIAPRLHHWTAPHPGWEPDPEPESPADWPEAVGSVLFEAPDAVVFIDPQVPEALWESLDALVAGRPVAVLTTMRFHGRSRDAVLARYGGEQVRFDAPMPEGIEAFGFPRFDETINWLPEPRALVPGDRLIGDANGGARLCPESWLGYIKPAVSVDDLRAALAPLGELPVEHLLLSHGAPVVGGGGEALARALAAAPRRTATAH